MPFMTYNLFLIKICKKKKCLYLCLKEKLLWGNLFLNLKAKLTFTLDIFSIVSHVRGEGWSWFDS